MSERPLRVLVVDDNRDTAQTLGVLLRSEGYEVRLAQSGTEALLTAEWFGADVALLDIKMPDQSGFDVAEELRRRYGSKCPVLIAVSAYGDDANRQKADISGFHDFVVKPYNAQAVLDLLDDVKRNNA